MRAGSGIWRREGNVRGLLRSALFGSILALSASRPVFKADLYVIDGGSGKTRALADHNDLSHWLDQSDTTKQCALPAGHADFNGQLCLSFTGVEWYPSNRAASQFRYCHDGTGFEGTHVYTRTGTLAGTQIIASTNNLGSLAGHCHWFNSTPTTRAFISNGSTTVSSIGATAPGADVPTHSTVVYDESLPSGQRVQVLIKGTVGVQANPGASPSSGDPQGALRLGAASGGTAQYVGRWQSCVYSPTLPSAARATKWDWIQRETSIAA